MKKRFLCILLLFATILLSVSCSGSYPPVASTAEEARTVMTFTVEGDRYEMKYELYRALFLTYRDKIDGGDRTVWSSDKSEEYIEKIDALIKSSAADIFATLHLAKKLGFNPYSSEVEAKIEDYVAKSVEGYYDGNTTVLGFDGDYNAYLASLKAMNLNYSVQTLLYRYSIAHDSIVDYYAGTVDLENPMPGMTEGKLEYTEADVLAFYNGDSSARVLLATLDTRSFTEARAKEIREKIASYSGMESVSNYIMSFTATTQKDAKDGMTVGKYSLDDAYYSELSAAAMTLSVGQTSEVIRISREDGLSYFYIIYKAEKNAEYYKNNYADVESAYVSNKIGEIINSVKVKLLEGEHASELYSSLDRSQISMP